MEDGKLVVVGIAQEQHGDRCRLFAQWQEVGWPILHDPINFMRVRGVPIEVAIDEYGIVRSMRPELKTLEEEFIGKTFEGDVNYTTLSDISKYLAITPDDTSLSIGSYNANYNDTVTFYAEITEADNSQRKLSDKIILFYVV